MIKQVSLQIVSGISVAVWDRIQLANGTAGQIEATNKKGYTYLFPARFVSASRNIVPSGLTDDDETAAKAGRVTFASLLGIVPAKTTESDLSGYRVDYGKLKSLFATVCQIASSQRKAISVQRMSVSAMKVAEDATAKYRVSEVYTTEKPSMAMLSLCNAGNKALANRKEALRLADAKLEADARAIIDSAGGKSAAAADRAADRKALPPTTKAEAAKAIVELHKEAVALEAAHKGKVSAKAATLASGISKATIASMVAPLGKSAKVNLVSGKVSKVSKK